MNYAVYVVVARNRTTRKQSQHIFTFEGKARAKYVALASQDRYDVEFMRVSRGSSLVSSGIVYIARNWEV